MKAEVEQGNTVLRGLLAEAGWSSGALARAVNAEFGALSIAETAPYYWLDTGSVPRGMVPLMVASVLSKQLGRTVSARHIWPGYSGPDEALVQLADQGLDGPSTAGSGLDAATAWLTPGDIDRRTFLAVSGMPLLQALWGWLEAETALPEVPTTEPAGHPLIDFIEASLPGLQRLDDAHGGAAHLGYVQMQVAAAVQVLRSGQHPGPVASRLRAAIATMAQLAGWMAHDANRQGLAQRYWFVALRAAHRIGDRPLAAHILADVAFQTASVDPESAVVIAEEASQVAAKAPATVRASVSSRLAYCYAAAGRRTDFVRTYADARTHLERREDLVEPSYMYFLTDAHLDCQAGYAMIAMGRRQLRLGDRAGRANITAGDRLLRRGAHEAPSNSPSGRRALYEGLWLALGSIAIDDRDSAFALVDRATSRLPQVNSPRSIVLLDRFAADLRRRTRNPAVREYLPKVQEALEKARR